MADLRTHCNDCKRELGETFSYVHEWLDELYPKLGSKHRSVRHHRDGVEEVRRKWGDRAAQAAEIHIRRDWGVVLQNDGNFIPTKDLAQMWSLFGPASVTKEGGSFLTDEVVMTEIKEGGCGGANVERGRNQG